MNENEMDVLRILVESGAYIEGHFILQSGKHSSAYINKDALYMRVAQTSRICRMIAEWFIANNVEVVIAPAIGGVALSVWTAVYLSEMGNRDVFAIYAEKEKTGSVDEFVIKRGYDEIVAGKNVLVVDDVLTTGGSARKVIEATRACGGNVVGLGVLWNRGGISARGMNVPRLAALVNEKLETWDENSCLLCWRNIPIDMRFGYGREFLVRRANTTAASQRET